MITGDQRLPLKIINSLFFVFFALCFALTFYPPYQIPVMYVLAFLGIGYVLSKRLEISTRSLRSTLFILLICILIIGGILALYYVDNRFSIQTMLNTSYPGARQSVGKDSTFLLKMLAGFYNIQLQNDLQLPPEIFQNQSETASFFFLSIFLVPFYLAFIGRSLARRQPVNMELLMSLAGLVFLLVWGVFGLPTILARLFLLNYVTPQRSLLAMNLVNHLLILFYLFKQPIEKNKRYQVITLLYSLIVFFTVLLLGIFLKQMWPGYMGGGYIILFMISLLTGCLMYLLLNQREGMFIAFFLLFTMGSTLYINPLYRGLSPLQNEKANAVIQKVNNPPSAWMVYQNGQLANYLAGNGVRVLNGTYYTPNLEFWSKFDPDHQYTDVYNRYAHIIASPIKDPQQVVFELIQMDVVHLKISPCNPHLAEVGVNYFSFAEPQNDYACLSYVDKIEMHKNTVYIYKRIPE